MSVVVMYQTLVASEMKAMALLAILVIASFAVIADTSEARMDAAIWLTEAPSDHGQADICPCQALLTCTAAGHGLISNGENGPLPRPQRAFACPERTNAHGLTAGVPTPPPKIA